MKISIMIEGQNGLNWPRWQRIVKAIEDLGFHGLFRSDHYTNANPPDLDSLELWVSLTWLAGNTTRIEFGPLVTPVSFRHPTMTARMASAVDDLSKGRLVLGVGAGWQEREHANYSWDLMNPKDRFDRFEEGVEIITRLFRSDQSFDFQGKYYQLHDALLLPRPNRKNGPAILIGGNGQKRTLHLAARYASAWNALFLTPAQFLEANQRLNSLAAEMGRPPADIHRSMMTTCLIGSTKNEVSEQAAARKSTPDELKQKGVVIGTPEEITEQLGQYAEAGLQQIMLQWLNLDDIDGLELLARQVLPIVQGSSS